VHPLGRAEQTLALRILADLEQDPAHRLLDASVGRPGRVRPTRARLGRRAILLALAPCWAGVVVGQKLPEVAVPDKGIMVPHVATVAAATSSSSSTPAPVRIIGSNLSASLTGLMEHVVTTVPSYAQATYIPGYYVGGKTGTAQIWDPTLNKGKGGWMDNIYNYSFYGWVGQSAPDLAIGAVIYQGTPTKVAQGVLAMPVQSTQLFRRIATDSIVSEQIAPIKNGPTPPSGQNAKSLG